jgi:O-phospho-L-seryl-tRNASec:L-selenocysteinyl-tRNA synthase
MSLLTHIVSTRRYPATPTPPHVVSLLLSLLLSLDSHREVGHVGVGEREGRVYSSLLRERGAAERGGAHGVGRSGDVAAVQPKAKGSSTLLRLAAIMTKAALIDAGLSKEAVAEVAVMPGATGATLALVLGETGRSGTVLWSRVDQKTARKCIHTAGPHLTPLTIELTDDYRTDVPAFEAALSAAADGSGPPVAAILATTSCFAPRQPDDIPALAALARRFDVPLIVNNAYGVQSPAARRAINRAVATGGRVDMVVQSCDKNFLTPVGGAVAFSPDAAAIPRLQQFYAGRASAVPVTDMVVTLLEMGKSGWQQVLADREALVPHMLAVLERLAADHGERILGHNDVSFAMTLDRVGSDAEALAIGGALFSHGVTGMRVVTPSTATKTIGPVTFRGWGSHRDPTPTSVRYATVAVAVGMTRSEIDTFAQKFDKVLKKFARKRAKAEKRGQSDK